MSPGRPRLARFALVRFACVGGAAALTDLALFWLCNQRMGWSRIAAQTVSRPAGGLVSFSLNKIWTFRNREWRAAPRQAARYAAIWISGFLASSLLIEAYRAGLQGAPRADFWAKLLAETTLGLLSFLAQRHWAFRRSGPGPA